jgi:hypothetical protein
MAINRYSRMRTATTAGKLTGVRPDLTGRGERIRTSDSCVPNAVLYQAELRPDVGMADS